MIILHGAFDRGFFIWGECSFTRAGLHNLRRMRRAGAETTLEHIWDPGAAPMIEALAEVGYAYKGGPAGRRVAIELPTFAEKYPIPSSPLLGEIPTHHIKRETTLGMKRWYVQSLPLEVTDMIDLLPIAALPDGVSQDGCLLCRGVMMALDLCFIVECCRFALSLMERGRFLPDVKVAEEPYGEARYESIWRPLLIGDDALRFGKLEAMTPRILRALNRRSGRPDVLGEILDFIIDDLVREAWTGKLKNAGEPAGASPGRLARALVTRADASLAERKRRGRLVNALNPHALWARSLGWLGETEGLSQSLESIHPDVRDWWNRFEWFAKAPFKLCLKLLDAPRKDGSWRMEYAVKQLNTGEMIAAADAWRWPEGPADAFGDSGDYMRRYMLLLLGRIGEVIPAIMRSLRCHAPTGCDLTHEEAADFLATQATDLAGYGIGIACPDWWDESTPDKLTLRGRLVSGRVDPAVFDEIPGLKGAARSEEKLTFRWEMALHGDVLTEEERDLVEGPVPLVNVRGRWTFVHTGRLESVRDHITALPVELSATEALRLAVQDPFIDGFSDAPLLEEIFDSLRENRPLRRLESPKSIRGQLRAYQERGYAWLSFLSRLGMGACLADDMGLGKTVQALAMIQKHRDDGDRRPVLLICPTSVLENWRLEMARFFPRMTPYLHHGRGRARDGEFARNARRHAVVMTSYALLHRDVSSLQAVDWMGILLDEAQNIKNPDTQQARACRSIKSGWRVVLTGTPIENHVGDLWSIMEFLMPGMLGSRRFFTNEYVKPIQKGRDAALLESLKRTVSPFIMRRMKTDREIVPDLPQKIETKVFCGLKKEQVSIYSEITSALGRELAGAGGIRRKGLVLAALTRIKQVCDHPSLVAKDGDFSCGRSAKLERMLALAEEMFEAGDKTLIFTQYVEMGNILKHQLQEAFGKEVLFLHGAIFKDARDRMVRRFQEESGAQFFVLSLKAGGVGLNLTGANHVVMYDRWWNPAVENQAIDRAYRIGQKRNVHVHVFCCRGTLEERIDELISSKKEVANRVIDSSDNWITELSDRELQRLISLSPKVAEA